jgi:quinol monooxygenase YgiN
MESCKKLSELDDAQIEELCTRVSSALFGGAAEPPNLRDTMEQSRQEAGTISAEVQRDLEGEIAFKWRSSLEALRLCRTTMATFCEALKSKVDARFLATTEQGGKS